MLQTLSSLAASANHPQDGDGGESLGPLLEFRNARRPRDDLGSRRRGEAHDPDPERSRNPHGRCPEFTRRASAVRWMASESDESYGHRSASGDVSPSLLDNDRNQLELFTALLLLSLPGSPVMYYGDEIGMGDNIWLGDRDGVRTPMQWTPDRNGGFSSCDPQRLYLPPVMDPIYGYQALNVEAQQRIPQSLLHWTRRMIEIRKRHPVFGLGAYEELASSNPSVLAFVREYDAAGLMAAQRLLADQGVAWEHDPSDRILCLAH